MSSESDFSVYRRPRLSAALWAWLLLLSTPSHGGQAIPFGGWTVNSGTIDTDPSCQQLNVVCKVLVDGNGFRQELVDAGSEGLYIRTIITDDNATGDPDLLPFESETFTPFDDTARATWSFDSRTAIRDVATGFTSVAMLDKDPFVDASNNTLTVWNVDMTQTINTAEIVSDFQYMSNEVTGFADPANDIFGKTIDIDTDLFLSDPNCTAGNASCDPNWSATQRFVQRDREGMLVDVFADTLTVTPITTQGSMSLDPSVVTVAWNDGDAISTHWIAQTDNQGGSSFSMNYQSITNNDALVDPFADFSSSSMAPPLDPFAWDANFGPPPPTLP